MSFCTRTVLFVLRLAFDFGEHFRNDPALPVLVLLDHAHQAFNRNAVAKNVLDAKLLNLFRKFRHDERTVNKALILAEQSSH